MLFSCRKEQQELILTENHIISSYEDLFNSFWTTIDRNYNYFNEEKINWNDIHKRYIDRFRDLKTFNKRFADKDLAIREMNLASKYFSDILSKMLDNHLYIRVTFPFPHANITVTREFSTRTKARIGVDGKFSQFLIRKNIVIDKEKAINEASKLFVENTSVKRKVKFGSAGSNKSITDLYILGMLKNMRDSTLYFALNEFKLSEKAIIFADIAFPIIPRPKKIYSTYDDRFVNLPESIADNFKIGLHDIDDLICNGIDRIRESNEYKNILNHREKFIKTEIMDCLSVERDLILFEALFKQLSKDILVKVVTYMEYYSKRMPSALFTDILDPLINKVNKMRDDYANISSKVKDCHLYELFFNKLGNGSIKKIIIDLRDNLGGDASDRKHLIDRLITKKNLYGYERTKEGNGRFNYIPWVPVYTSTHPFGLKSPIPVVILMDERSASMSEVLTIMLKTQGKVKVIGDYSGGAFAGLSSDKDLFNGGLIGGNEYLYFYMPVMAFKDKDNNVLEGKGVRPDIFVIPTEDDILNNRDPALQRAIEEIDKMN
ncbi:hypothetical protein JBKA6_0200 [Ichthyobacterium seriolicida]|uniref:Tail specific protease domain-containing protein n=1 Tax=Ichthyobacterium seriolicida TaxID=242600 RepID=A0A1J1DZV7_9FLAO|nr:hypothetical protein JBKA6_0200 [Ichthyobacterium seriolicida]